MGQRNLRVASSRAVRRAAIVGLSIGALAGAVPANDWYVDVVHGSDANAGTTPGTAWKTITHAIAQLQAPTPDTIHIAPGRYDPTQGEVFPWTVRDSLQLVGDAGSAATVISGGGAASALVQFLSINYSPAVGAQTQLRQLTLRDAQIGVFMQSDWAHVEPYLADLRITTMSVAGIALDTPLYFTGTVGPTLERVRVTDCAVGLSLQSRSSVGFDAHDCDFSYNTAEGVYVACTVDAAVTLTGCRVVGNGSHGVSLDGASVAYELWAHLDDCQIARNGGDGLRGALQSHLAFQFVRRCTIAHNASAGFRDGAVTSTSIVSSILWANADDLVFLPGAAPGVSYSDVSDGDFAGANGNFSAEPRFVDPAGVDYRLQWGSLCIEAGDPATPAGALDLAGLARPIDGNLDTVEAPDVGAYEFAPLYPRGSGRIGSYFTLELWGAAGSATSLWWTRGTTVSPSATPFGELDLDPTTMRLLFSGAASPGPPSVWTRRIPDDPTLIGRSFAFQSLTDCAAAPLGRAWTNAVVLHVVP